nr:uncharacterized protein LOC129524221 [Gorilla gorilla gorilla]
MALSRILSSEEARTEVASDQYRYVAAENEYSRDDYHQLHFAALRNLEPRQMNPLARGPQMGETEDGILTTLLCSKFLPEGPGRSHATGQTLTFLSAYPRISDKASLS